MAEKTKKTDSKKVNMSEVEGSASKSIVDWWSTYNFEESTPKQIIEDLRSIIPEDRLEEPKVKNLFKNLSYAKNVQQSATTIGNFVLSGDHEGVVGGTRERDRKFLKNFGRK